VHLCMQVGPRRATFLRSDRTSLLLAGIREYFLLLALLYSENYCLLAHSLYYHHPSPKKQSE
uniref:Uncharacterized protein n=1 Tax=Aegilops tauschii subsp. strangulata TaxID=200361 RepID=A0A453AQW0_AEGTS